MIYIVDDFLDKKLLNKLNKSFLFNFEKIIRPSCTLYAKKAPKEFTQYMESKISILEGKQIESCLCGFRYSDEKKDNHWRIHADLYLDDTQECFPERAGVLYMDKISDDLTGTAFWENKKTKKDSIDLNDINAHNKTLSDAADLSKWNLKSIIGHKKNRFVSYPCSSYHSKYPNITIDPRVVCVIFYKFKNV
jgi:hypothetical protein